MTQDMLQGYTVIEIAHPLTEYAGCVLAGLGAQVYLIEPPQGAITRDRRPFVPQSRMPGPEKSNRGSLSFLARNVNKRSVVIDTASLRDRDLLMQMISLADVVIDVADSPYSAVIASADPGVHITLTDARQLGTSSIVPFAASGGMASSGWPDRPPCNAPGWLALDGASIYAACLALIGSIEHRQAARRVRYRVPLEEAAVAALTPWTRPLFSYDMDANGQGKVTRRMGDGGFPIYRARNGYVRVVIATPRQWQAFVTLLGEPDELVNGPWNDPQFRLDNLDALQVYCQTLTAQHSVETLFHQGQRLGLTISPLSRLSDFRSDPHIEARELFVEVEDPEFGTLEMMRPPIVFDEADGAAALQPAPALNQHRREAELFAASPRKPGAQEEIKASSAPLQGIRILELGVGAVVPEAAAFLAAFGAEVIKIESHVRPDFLRRRGIRGFDDPDGAATFNQLNLGVKSVAVDMSHPEGVQLIGTLATECDVVMENMRGGVVRKWGLDYEGIRQLRPDVIYLSSQGLGRGPYDGYQTYGPNLQTFSGVTWQWSHPDDPLPVGTTLNHPDHMAGKQALVPLLAAILARLDTGEGRFMEGAQVEAAAYLMSDRYLAQSLSREELEPIGNYSDDFAPHGCYPCQGDDRWIALAIETQAQWVQLTSVVDRILPTGLSASSDVAARIARRTHLDEWLGAWTRTQDAAVLEGQLRALGIPVSRVMQGQDIAEDKSLHANGFYTEIDHGEVGARTYTGLPVLEGDGTRVKVTAPPQLGQHTDEVLSRLTPISARDLARLRHEKIVGY